MEKVQQSKNEFWEWTKSLLIAFAIAFLIRIFIFAPIVVDGESMAPTLQNEERMIVNKITYKFKEPKRYDIVVFHASEEQDYIKRIIGLPGEHIAYKDDQLYINGEPYEEPYLESLKEELNEFVDSTLTEDFTLEECTGVKKIPEGYVFVMGDNRRFSTDSRIIGLVSMKEIIGKTNFVFWPLDEMEIIN